MFLSFCHSWANESERPEGAIGDNDWLIIAKDFPHRTPGALANEVEAVHDELRGSFPPLLGAHVTGCPTANDSIL